MKPSSTSTTIVRELKQRRRWRQRERQKSSRSILAKQQLCTCIARLCTFLCRRCATSTWNCLNSRFVEYVNTRQRFCNSFLKHRYSPLEFISRKIHQHLTNWTTWNKSDKFLNSVNSRFKRRFHHRRRRCRLRCPRGGVLGLICPPPPTSGFCHSYQHHHLYHHCQHHYQVAFGFTVLKQHDLDVFVLNKKVHHHNHHRSNHSHQQHPHRNYHHYNLRKWRHHWFPREMTS